MKNLKEFQEHFIKELMGQGPFRSELKLKPVRDLNQEKLHQVYRGDYIARMTECLGSNYEAVWLVLGDEDFFELSAGYIESHPSSFRDLLYYGDKFPEFLKEHCQEFPFLFDLGSFEREFWRLFHMELIEDRSFKIDPHNQETIGLLQIDKPDAHAIIRSNYKIYDLWQNREDSSYLDERSFEDFIGNQTLYLRRGVSGVEQYVLTDIQALIIEGLIDGLSLGEIFEKEDSLEEQSAEDWAQFFNIIPKI